MFPTQCEELRINHVTPFLVVTMPYACWFLWQAYYIEDFNWHLHFQFGVAFWRVVLRGIFWRAKLCLKGIEDFNLEQWFEGVSVVVLICCWYIVAGYAARKMSLPHNSLLPASKQHFGTQEPRNLSALLALYCPDSHHASHSDHKQSIPRLLTTYPLATCLFSLFSTSLSLFSFFFWFACS